MDPRPYHFEYRKPRYSNPTYQSINLYDSIYQISTKNKNNEVNYNPETQRYRKVNDTKPMSQPDKVRRNQSMQLPKKDKLQLPRVNSKYQIPPLKTDLKKTEAAGSKLSNYGYNLMRGNSVDQKDIFDRQQHAFDIINYHPNKNRATLKMFPKLTLEDKINERRQGSPLKH